MGSGRASPYDGELNESIVLPPEISFSAQAREVFIRVAREKKLGLLLHHYGIVADDPQGVAKLVLYLALAHYGIAPDDPGGLGKLAVYLAMEDVPGMRVSDAKTAAPRGAPKKWTMARATELVDVVDQINRERGRGVPDAIGIALKRQLLKGKSTSLEARYYECKGEIELAKRFPMVLPPGGFPDDF